MTTLSNDLSRFDGIGAETLLGISRNEPERLFTGNNNDLRTEYHYLARRWHPDLNKAEKANEVFQHLKELHIRAEAKLIAGTWQRPGELILHDLNGRQKQLKYKKKFSFELGEAYISSTLVTYVIRPEHKALYTNALSAIKGLSFADDKMRDECTRYLPKIKAAFESREGCVLVLEKAPDLVRLRDVLDYYEGKLEPAHTAWVLSTIHNLSCYLSWANLTHNDINLDTYFISPKGHSGTLLGGWWYATSKDTTLRALPDRTYDHAPPDVLRKGNADPRVDLGLIRLTGRELLGDPAGTHIHLDKGIPKPMAAWLRLPTSGQAMDDYKSWFGKILPESFGARRYVEMKIDFSDIYDSKGDPPWAPLPTKTGASTPLRPEPAATASSAAQPQA